MSAQGRTAVSVGTPVAESKKGKRKHSNVKRGGAEGWICEDCLNTGSDLEALGNKRCEGGELRELERALQRMRKEGNYIEIPTTEDSIRSLRDTIKHRETRLGMV